MLSSHDLSEVASVCERAAILREGHLVELAPISKIVQQGEKQLKVWFADGSSTNALPELKPPGVRIIQQNANTLQIAYQGSIDAVLKWLADWKYVHTCNNTFANQFIRRYNLESP